MCGIVGIVSASITRDRTLLGRMRDSMRHRGPDDAGEWHSPDGRVALGHRRLAIIDLSPGGHQPMADSTGTLCRTSKGEIYNHQDLRRDLSARGHVFRTASDTEVILEAYRAWRTDCLAHLNGMFAFGLYDTERRRIFAARDRAGEKPLFYCPYRERISEARTRGLQGWSVQARGSRALPSPWTVGSRATGAVTSSARRVRLMGRRSTRLQFEC